MKPLPQLNKLIKRFNKINKNVGVNRDSVRTSQSGRAGLGGGGGGGGGRYKCSQNNFCEIMYLVK